MMEYFTRIEEIEPNVYGVTLRRIANIHRDIAHMTTDDYRSGKVPTFDYEFDELQFIGIDKFKIRMPSDCWPCECKTYRVGLTAQQLFGWCSNQCADVFYQWTHERGIRCTISRDEMLPEWNELIGGKSVLKIPLFNIGGGYSVRYCMTLKDFVTNHFDNNEVRDRIYNAVRINYSDTGKHLRKLLSRKNQIDAAIYLLQTASKEKEREAYIIHKALKQRNYGAEESEQWCPSEHQEPVGVYL